MNNIEVPDNLGGLGELLPADVLKMVNELLEQLHQKEKDHQGSTVINIYGKGSLQQQIPFSRKTHRCRPCSVITFTVN